MVQVGHTGTLDPMATGLLIVCIGKATKLVERYCFFFLMFVEILPEWIFMRKFECFSLSVSFAYSMSNFEISISDC